MCGGGGGGDRILERTGNVSVLYRRSGWAVLDDKWYSHGCAGRTV